MGQPHIEYTQGRERRCRQGWGFPKQGGTSEGHYSQDLKDRKEPPMPSEVNRILRKHTKYTGPGAGASHARR